MAASGATRGRAPPNRIIVDQSVADAFVDKLAERAGALTSGSPFDEGTMVGPVVTTASSRHVTELIDDATSEGATLATRGDSEGAVHSPAVVVGVTLVVAALDHVGALQHGP